MFLRLVSSALVAVLAIGCLAVQADAGDRRAFRRGPAHDHFYAGPKVVRAMPGLRLLFGDYALSDEEYDALYGEEEGRFDESYYEPEPVAPPKTPQKNKSVTAAPQPEPELATASIEEPPAKPAAKASTGMSCGKATSIITGYGFSAVKPKTCAGKVYAFNASRDGKPFSIKLDAASGELTEVKKLQ